MKTNKKRIDAAVRQRERQKYGFGAWWNKNGYKVMRIILWFIWIPILLYEKYINRKRKSFVENSQTTKKWLNKTFPKIVACYCDDPSVIMIMLTGYGECYADIDPDTFCRCHCISKRARKYFRLLSHEQREQMILDYEIDGYKKIIVSHWQDWDKVINFFNWEDYYNYNKDYDKAVIFYDGSKYPELDYEKEIL